MKSQAGSIIAIPNAHGFGMAKIIFNSSYFKDMILIKLFHVCASDLDALQTDPEPDGFNLYYTGIKAVRIGRWPVIGKSPVTADELLLTKRKSAGEIWIEDNHLGPASEHDLQTLPEMVVHGGGLIEKYAARLSNQIGPSSTDSEAGQ